MLFFEGKMELYLLLYLLVIPFITSCLFYKLNHKILRVSPIVSFILGMLLSAFFFPFYFTDIVSNNYDFTTVYWMMFVIPLHVISSLFFMGLFYIIRYFKTRNKIKT